MSFDRYGATLVAMGTDRTDDVGEGVGADDWAESRRSSVDPAQGARRTVAGGGRHGEGSPPGAEGDQVTAYEVA
ncbi:hypothetical protein GCM10009548_90370 [Streptomyces malaysiensis subsp. malaysiensis]|uniref:Uncharacterized protein n=1 Tax=Streptomyces malaysiensis TaxID=92644 RepID=A0ABX6VYZ7_STRMQ|nr:MULTISPECIES: hypothetical protein [Streptomyces]QPI54532.1 hypothetical protein I1A49_05885 [Streptomyces solisilvae]UHH15929.1 hypothetical protein LUV23_05990 [Streptomyces sp. HNM0561]